ncbi:unnamed protein product [Protopolystoma xenopodis]|uniref:Uncharacterized protein n=1 Tax=Protopolystoma xenopodis TaxID=117903 RepID=A0A448WD25_9PLAT|nr:unnamed protein product [Protopolystoma xenopodis]
MLEKPLVIRQYHYPTLGTIIAAKAEDFGKASGNPTHFGRVDDTRSYFHISLNMLKESWTPVSPGSTNDNDVLKTISTTNKLQLTFRFGFSKAAFISTQIQACEATLSQKLAILGRRVRHSSKLVLTNQRPYHYRRLANVLLVMLNGFETSVDN